MAVFDRFLVTGSVVDGIDGGLVPFETLRTALREPAVATSVGLPPHPSDRLCRAWWDEATGGGRGADGISTARACVRNAPDGQLFVSGVRFTLQDGREHDYGIYGNDPSEWRSFDLLPGEWLVEVRGRSERGVTRALQFVSSHGRRSEWCGRPAGAARGAAPFSFRVTVGRAIAALGESCVLPAEHHLGQQLGLMIAWVADRPAGAEAEPRGLSFRALLRHLTRRVADVRERDLRPCAVRPAPELVAAQLFESLPAPGADGAVPFRAVCDALAALSALRLELNWPLSTGELSLRRHLLPDPGADADAARVDAGRLREFIRIRCLFNYIDEDGSGYIDQAEFGDALSQSTLATALGVPADSAASLFTELDADRSLAVVFDEFARRFAGRLPPPEESEAAWSGIGGDQNEQSIATDRYEVIKPLGEGHFGVTSLVRRRSDGVLFAMKQQKQGGSVGTQREWKQEAVMLKRLKHRHIVRLVDVAWQPDGRLDIVMEFAEGGELKRVVAQGPVDPASGQRYIHEALDAVRYLHDRRVLHRDIKPENIFLTAGGSVKLGDVGLTRKLSAGQEGMREVMSTIVYMAPELLQMMDTGMHSRGYEYSYPVDCWALGCVLYELATGTMVFPSARPDGSPLPPDEWHQHKMRVIGGDGCPTDIPEWCEQTVQGLLTWAPEDRWTADTAWRATDPDAPVVGPPTIPPGPPPQGPPPGWGVPPPTQPPTANPEPVQEKEEEDHSSLYM